MRLPVLALLEGEQAPGCRSARLSVIEPVVENLDLPALILEQRLQSPDMRAEFEGIL